MIREVPVKMVEDKVQEMIAAAAYRLPDDYLQALVAARQQEQSPVGQAIILTLQDNAAYAQSEQIPTCQDTGMAVLFLEVGQDVHFTGGSLPDALTAATRRAYKPLRKSVIASPVQRTNTGDNTPPLVHYQIVPGDGVRITALLKGFGGEMMSRLQMFPPSTGLEGVRQFVVETVEQAGPNACPPVIVGVGLGSSFDGVAGLAKKALLRPLGTANPDPQLAKLEQAWLAEVNALGIGPQGFGGLMTALAVHIESYPTHIAALPVAVNLNCSAPRRATIVI